MAAIDKLYVKSYEQFIKFKEWCEKQPPIKDKYGKDCTLISYLFSWCTEDWWQDKESSPIFQAPCFIDAYIIRNCPLDFIQESIKWNYGDSYKKILNNELYTSPSIDCEYGKHFTILQRPTYGNVNRPYRGTWRVDVMGYDLWYNHNFDIFKSKEYGTWDNILEFVESEYISSSTFVPSMRTLRRLLTKKWKFPVGTVLRVTSRYYNEEYKILIRK